MCGRFCCALDPETIRARIYKDNISKDKDIEWVNQDRYHSSYNVCPSNNVIVMYFDHQEKRTILRSMQWGYIPSWSRNTNMNKPINARIETLVDKCMFDGSKNSKRCIIIAEGFFEWKKLSNNKRQPYYVTRKDGQLMAFAGLFDANSIIGNNIFTCTIITTHASEFFKPIHHRMPVILDTKDIMKWIDSRTAWSQPIIDLLTPYEGELNCFQVSDAVGTIKNDSPDLIVPIDTKKSSISYFLKQEEPIDKFEKFAIEQVLDNSSQESNKKRKLSSTLTSESTKQKKKSTSNNGTKITNFFGKKVD